MKAFAVLTLLAACGGSSDLDADAVTSIPPGTGTGSAMTGSYRTSSVTTDCSGDCTTSVDGLRYSACDIGTRLEDTVTVTQDDGRLKMDVEDSDYVSRLEGGIDDDGTFEVGGLRTQLGGRITITARTLGTFAGTSLTGTARLRVTGNGLGCHIEVDVDGARR